MRGHYQKFGSQTFHTKGVTLVDCWIYVLIDYQCTTLTLRRFAFERNLSDSALKPMDYYSLQRWKWGRSFKRGVLVIRTDKTFGITSWKHEGYLFICFLIFEQQFSIPARRLQRFKTQFLVTLYFEELLFEEDVLSAKSFGLDFKLSQIINFDQM